MNALSRILARFTFLRCLVLALALPATAAVATTFPNSRSTYSITKTSTGFSVTDNVGTGGTAVLTGSTQIIFADMTVNLLIGDLSRTIAASDLKTLIELYIAFFNRIPEADGLAYWINQYKGGMTMDQITNSFYVAAIQYSSLTGYSSSMSDADFVAIIYKNVLGRTGPTAPTETEVHYWADQITSGALSRYGVTASMLNAAHAYAGDPVWGWVPQLLDNKFSVATIFCLEQGLNYNTPEESITKGMAIAAAVTSSSIADAVNLIGITDAGFNLTLVTDSKAVSFGSIAYGNNLYVSIFQNSFSTSTDGQTWSGPIPGVDWKFSKVIWDKAQFVAIGQKGMTATSADGLQWTLRKTGTDYDLLYVERVNDVLIATGMPPFFAFYPYPPMLQSVTLTSSDGVTWSVQTANINARHFTFGAGTLVVLNTYTDSSSEIYRSFDGVNWVSGALPPISDMPTGAIHRFLTKIAYGNGQFVVIVEFRDVLAGMVGYALYSSADGVEWTARYNALSIDGQSRLNAITYTGDQFVVVGSDGIILTSADGLSWIQRDPGTKSHLYTVAFARGLLIAGGVAGTVLTSQNGITWTSRITDVLNGLFEIRYTGTAFYALMSVESGLQQGSYYDGSWGTNRRRTTENLMSLDGVTWTAGPAQAGARFDELRDY